MFRLGFGVFAMAARAQAGFVTGQIKVDTLLAYIFGVIFIASILGFVTLVINPNALQIQTFKTVLGLAGAGVAAVIPGQFQFKHLPFIRAGGAIAVFALIFLTPIQAVSSIVKIVVPPEAPDAAIQTYLWTVDHNDLTTAWQLNDESSMALQGVNERQWIELLTTSRVPLADAEKRTVGARGGAVNPPGEAPGVYRYIMYFTKFKNTVQCRQEIVSVRATEQLTWRVTSHHLSTNEVPCPKT